MKSGKIDGGKLRLAPKGSHRDGQKKLKLTSKRSQGGKAEDYESDFKMKSKKSRGGWSF